VTLRAAQRSAALECLGALGQIDRPLGELTTYRVGGSAAVFVEVRTTDDLERVVAARQASGLPIVVIGRGSNLLVADAGFEGIAVVLTGFDQIHIAECTRTGGDDGRVVVEAGAAVPLPVLARRTAAVGLTGFEWAVGVPGSLGGAVRMNAGGHGADMAGCLIDVDVVDLECGRMETRRAEDVGLSFRFSGLADHEVVTSARLGLVRGERAAAERVVHEVVRWRRQHQPGGQNCGSVFVNPIPGEVPAAVLIERVGLRGHRYRSACVSSKHANFIQADEGGSADDVKALIDTVRLRVAEQTGYLLRSEVRLVGFDGGVDGVDGEPGESGELR